MKIGIITEYNPLHNGHLKFINEIKNKYPESELINIMSGDIVLRGDVAINSKFERAKYALESGVDCIFELSPYSSLNGSDIFAEDSINFLVKAGIDKLIFGSENGTIDELEIISKKIIENNDEILNEVKNNNSTYAKEVELLLKKRLKPNEILGVSYLKALSKIDNNIEVETIKRTNSKNITSASKIREMIKKDIKYGEYVKNELNDSFNINDLWDMICIEIINYPIKQGTKDATLLNYLKKNINNYSDLNSLLESSPKSYTHSEVRRIILKNIFKVTDREDIILLGFKKDSKSIKDIDKSLYQVKFKSNMKSREKIAKVLNLKYRGYFDKQIKSTPIII